MVLSGNQIGVFDCEIKSDDLYASVKINSHVPKWSSPVSGSLVTHYADVPNSLALTYAMDSSSITMTCCTITEVDNKDISWITSVALGPNEG